MEEYAWNERRGKTKKIVSTAALVIISIIVFSFLGIKLISWIKSTVFSGVKVVSFVKVPESELPVLSIRLVIFSKKMGRTGSTPMTIILY